MYLFFGVRNQCPSLVGRCIVFEGGDTTLRWRADPSGDMVALSRTLRHVFLLGYLFLMFAAGVEAVSLRSYRHHPPFF